jgi:DNA primase
VLTLLRYGIKNAVAVEGTNVPDEVAALTQERTVTTFFDGDRGGELILRELAQVGDVDYVAFAPEDESVEDLGREAVIKALRNKVAFAALPDEGDLRAAVTVAQQSLDTPGHLSESPTPDADTMSSPTETAEVPNETPADGGAVAVERTADESAVETAAVEQDRKTLVDHVAEVVGDESGLARLLDSELGLFDEVAVEKIYETLEHTDTVPLVVIVDGEVSQKLVDIAAQRGVQHVIGRSRGEFVKKPISVRVRTASQLLP